MAVLTPSAPLSISIIESLMGLPPSEEASFASPSILDDTTLKKFSRTSILFIKLKSNPFYSEFLFADSRISSISLGF